MGSFMDDDPKDNDLSSNIHSIYTNVCLTLISICLVIIAVSSVIELTLNTVGDAAGRDPRAGRCAEDGCQDDPQCDVDPGAYPWILQHVWCLGRGHEDQGWQAAPAEGTGLGH